jgi:tetratricopeptide (TPR) repeat protein
MFSKHQFFKSILSSCMPKIDDLQLVRPPFRNKSYSSVVQIHHKLTVIIKHVEANKQKHSAKNIRDNHSTKHLSWVDLARQGKIFESVGTYSKALNCFYQIINKAKTAHKPLSSLQKNLLIDAYLTSANIIRIGSQDDEDRAIRYLDKVLSLDRNNLAAFKLKRSILADRYENISPEAVLTPYKNTPR